MPIASLSEPLLPSLPNKLPARKAMSYPFSQQEMLTEEALVAPESSHNDRLQAMATRLQQFSEPVTGLWEGASLAARAAIYQRERPAEMVVPTEGPSWQQVACVIATTLIGAGVLGLPYAMRQAGWAGLPLILATTFITSYTAKMLVWSFNELNDRKAREPGTPGALPLGSGFVATYDQLAEEVVSGSRAKTLARQAMKALTVLECYGCAVCYVVLHSVNWPVVLGLPELVFGVVPAPVAAVSGWAVCVLPLLLLKVQHLAVFGPIGLVAVGALLVASVVAPAIGAEPAPVGTACPLLDSSLSDADVMGEREWLRGDGMGVAVGLVLFCFGGHATFPEIYSRMSAEQRPHFPRAVDTGFTIAALFFVGLSSAGYAFYGSCAADTLTLNLMRSSPLFGKLSTVCVLANTFFSFPTFCAPVVRILNECVHSADAVDQLEADVVPVSEERLWRAATEARLEEVSAKVDAIGAAVLALANRSGAALPRSVTGALQQSMGAMRAAVRTADDDAASTTSTAASTATAAAAKASAAATASADAALTPPPSLLQAMSGRSLLVRVGLVLVAATLAVSVPNFGFVVALMGAFTTMLVSFLLPTAFFMAVFWSELSPLHLGLCAGVLAVGFLGMAVGLVNTLSGAA